MHYLIIEQKFANRMKRHDTLPQELLDIIEQLQLNSNIGITVTNPVNFKVIIANANLEKIENEYSSFQGFLEELHARKINKIRVVVRKKHGTSSIPVADHTFNLGDDDEPTLNFKPDMQEKNEVHEAVPLAGLIPQGLNAAQEQFYKAKDYDRLAGVLKKHEDEIALLKKKNKKLKKAEIHNLIESSKNSPVMQLLGEALPHLAPILQAKMGVAQAATEVVAMAGPEVSETKSIATAILNSLDDNSVYDLGIIMQNLKQNEELHFDLLNLIEKYNLDPAPNGDN